MWQTIAFGALTAVARNAGGWLKYSIADKKIEPYEWKQLAISSAVSLTIYFATIVPSNILNLGNEEAISVVVTMLLGPAIDKWIEKWNNRKAKIKAARKIA